MKKVLLLTLPFLLFACNSVEKHRATIESLAGNWGETTNQVTQFSEMLSGAVGNLNNAVGAMSLGEDVEGALNEEMQGKWTGAKAGVMEAIAGFAPIQNALGEFMKTWSEKSEVLSGLQSGLEAGQLDPAAVSQIPALQELVTGAGEKLTEWQGSFTEQNATATSALEQMKSVYDMIAGSN